MRKFWTLTLICAMAVSMAGQAVPVCAAETEDEGDEPVLENSGIYVWEEGYSSDISPGESLTLKPEVTETDYPEDLTWQWYRLDEEGELTLIEDATGSSYTVEHPMSGDTYYVCVYENDGDYEFARDCYYINVVNDLRVAYTPVRAVLGESATLSVEVEAVDTSDLTYQWLLCDDFYYEDYDYIEGANGSSYTIDSVDADNYDRIGCQVTDRYGNSMVIETPVDVDNLLTVRAVEDVGEEDENSDCHEIFVNVGESAQMNACVSAADTEGITYQWKILEDDDCWKSIPGAEESTWNTGAVSKTTAYRCEVEDRFGNVAVQDYKVRINTGFYLDPEETYMYCCVDPGTTCKMECTAVIDDGQTIHYAWYQYDEDTDTWEKLDYTDSTGYVVLQKESLNFRCAAYDDYGNNAEQYFELRNHSWKRNYTEAATLTGDGVRLYYCEFCDKDKEVTISRPKTFTLASASYTYDGKAKKPTLTVKDSKGKTISSSYYTYTAATGTNVGTYTCKVVFKGDYSGTKSLTYKINPKGTSLTKITAVSKGFKAVWTKQTAQTTGYQIRYATKSDMSDAKTVTVSKNTTVSQSVTKLTGAKKYYVQIRTYKTVSKVNYYSAWSKSLTVTTKK